jgi:hypothetical protein
MLPAEEKDFHPAKPPPPALAWWPSLTNQSPKAIAGYYLRHGSTTENGQGQPGPVALKPRSIGTKESAVPWHQPSSQLLD